MHFGINVQKSETINTDDLHSVIHVDNDLFNELEEMFTVRNAEEIYDDIHTDEKTFQVITTAQCMDYKKYIIHFICDLRCNTLNWLSDAIKTYAPYFVELHISLSSNIDGNHLNQNTNPNQISLCIEELKNVILNSNLSLNSFHLYINISSNIYQNIYSQLLYIMNDTLFDRFMFNHKYKLYNHSLCFLFALSEGSIEGNYWNDLHHFLSESNRIHHIEFVVKTKSSLYTDSNSHGIILNDLLKSLNDNKNRNTLKSLKLTCWGFINNCNIQTQTTFAKYLKSIIVNKRIQKLWLRYSGINEFILNYVFDGVQQNTLLTDLRIQRMLLNKGGKCLANLGKILRNHICIENVEIGWNMASIPDTKYYTSLLYGISDNCYNLKMIQIYGDNECKLNVLEIILTKNIILQKIKIHLMHWNLNDDDECDNNNEIDNKSMIGSCGALIDVIIKNQLYLQFQMKEMKKYLMNICEFPNVLVMNVLSFVYRKRMNENCLNVEVVMSYDEETYKSIFNIYNHKMTKLKQEIDYKLVQRQLKFQMTKQWPE